MDESALYELVHDAVLAALETRDGGQEIRMAKRMVGGRVLFEDDQGREARAVPVEAIFKKVTSIRDKLRVLEQKINANPKLTDDEKVSLQQYVTGCYGTLTTFNVLFREEEDRFRGGGEG